MTRRSFLLAGGGVVGAATLAGISAPGARAATDPYDHRTFGYGTFGTYDPKGSGSPGGLRCGIPAGSPQLTVDPHTTALTITKGGTYDLIRFDRRVIIATAEPVIFTRCLFTGPPHPPASPVPCLDARGAEVNVELYDCEITATQISPWLPGISGHDMKVWRCYLHEVTDAFDVFNTRNANGPVNVDIRGCFVTSLTYVTPDSNDSDNHTHNDGCEIFGGSDIALVGNCMEAKVSATAGNPFGGPQPDPYYPSSTAQCIAVVNTLGSVSRVVIDRNFLDYGAQSLTIIPGRSATCADVTITNNVFGRNQPLLRKTHDRVKRRRAILVDPACPVNNFPATTGPDTLCGNVYADDGSPVTIYRFSDGL